MAPRKNAAGVDAPLTVDGGKTAPAPETSTLATDPLPTVRVNNVNLGEIKSALDDVVKQFLTDQSFTPSLLHPTVHLSLGYASGAIALAACARTYYLPFEEGKPVLWLAVGAYGVLQAALWAWKRWVERGEVFCGKRRRVVKRIETDHVQIVSSTTLKPPPSPSVTFSPHTRPSSPPFPSASTGGSDPISPAALSPAGSPPSRSASLLPSAPAPAPASVSSSSKASTAPGPAYTLHLTLSTTSNNGKSLLRKSRVVSGRRVGEVVDEQGGVEEGEVRRWLAGLLVEGGLGGVDEVDGKDE